GLARAASTVAGGALGAARAARLARAARPGAAILRHVPAAGLAGGVRGRMDLPQPIRRAGPAPARHRAVTVAPPTPSRRAAATPHPDHPMIRETVAISATLCALVPALLPLAWAGVPATHDGLIHVQRLIELEAVTRQGAPFTRWLPDLAYGYGQPLL